VFITYKSVLNIADNDKNFFSQFFSMIFFAKTLLSFVLLTYYPTKNVSVLYLLMLISIIQINLILFNKTFT